MGRACAKHIYVCLTPSTTETHQSHALGTGPYVSCEDHVAKAGVQWHFGVESIRWVADGAMWIHFMAVSVFCPLCPVL